MNIHKNLSLKDAMGYCAALGIEVRQMSKGGHWYFRDPVTGTAYSRSQCHHDAGGGLVSFLRRAKRARDAKREPTPPASGG